MSNQIITSELLKEDPELIDLIDRFISRLPDMQSAIIRAYDEKEWDIFTSLIHQMKGVGGNYGYPILTRLCEEIEVTIKNKCFSDVNSQLESFKIVSENILAGSEENHNLAKSS